MTSLHHSISRVPQLLAHTLLFSSICNGMMTMNNDDDQDEEDDYDDAEDDDYDDDDDVEQ